jgi:hypothetical protein
MPIAAAVRWVWWVAEWGTRLAVPDWLNIVAWIAVLATVAHRITGVVRFGGHPRARL